jgi:hypothetical protein
MRFPCKSIAPCVFDAMPTMSSQTPGAPTGLPTPAFRNLGHEVDLCHNAVFLKTQTLDQIRSREQP